MTRLFLYAVLWLLPYALCEPGWAEVNMNIACTVTQIAPNELQWSKCPDILPVAEPSTYATLKCFDSKTELWGPCSASFQYDINGSLKIDKAIFDAILKDYPEAKLRVLLTNDPCLAQMEQAMRIMEKWIPRDIPRSMTFSEIDQKEIDWRKWDAAKACWKVNH